jgi:pilus assembly protein Flp/PilA
VVRSPSSKSAGAKPSVSSIKLTAAQSVIIYSKPNGSPLPGIRSGSQVSVQGIPMKNLFTRFARDDSAATAIEYGLIAAGISVAIIAVVNGIGTNLNASFHTVSTQLK